MELESDINNKTIYDLKYFLYTRITVEESRPKSAVVQCKRCQSYSHTKMYRTRSPIYVKCGGVHNTEVCTNKLEDKPMCRL